MADRLVEIEDKVDSFHYVGNADTYEVFNVLIDEIHRLRNEIYSCTASHHASTRIDQPIQFHLKGEIPHD